VRGHGVAATTDGDEPTLVERARASANFQVGLAVAGVWIAVVAASIWAPVMVTGSQHERLAIAALGDWLWGALATGLLLLAAAFTDRGRVGTWPAVSVIAILVWAAVALASIFAPTMVTGTDPTTIPLAALLAPIAGALVTAFLAVFAAGTSARGD